jgi:hypothetical protein
MGVPTWVLLSSAGFSLLLVLLVGASLAVLVVRRYRDTRFLAIDDLSRDDPMYDLDMEGDLVPGSLDLE